jgi:ribonuclease D
MVDSADALVDACDRLASAPCIGFDTEFERSRTFHARLALLQFDDARHGYLVDPLAVSDLEPVARLLREARGVIAMHAPLEDLEILDRAFGCIPERLFDTQLAAGLCGRGWGMGYDRLIEQLFGVTISKAATRSDWLQRPLSPPQVEYAAADVHYLPPAHHLLASELEDLGRRAWLDEEITHLVRRMREPEARRDFGKLVRRVGDDAAAVSRLHALCAWREAEARARDIPRRRVMDDALLSACAASPPSSLAALRRLAQELGYRGRTPHAVLLEAVEAAASTPQMERPVEAEDLRPYRRQLARLKNVVADAAGSLGLPEELLAPKRLLEQFLVRTLLRDEPPPEELLGWRAGILLDPLREALRSP